MAGLLVSVRSAEEAIEAVQGGATVIDVKEPAFGPLGRASVEVWRAVRGVVPSSTVVSVALGELHDWDGLAWPAVEGIKFRKLGLAGAGPGWAEDWAEVRRASPQGPRWVAVAYADWQIADAPRPDEVLEAAIEAEDCSGILVDTWDKSRRGPIDVSPEWIERARANGRFVALAGGLDLEGIARSAHLRPDLFAVRGAACSGSDRLGRVDAVRVARLVKAARFGI